MKHNNRKSLLLLLIFSLASFPTLAATDRSSPTDSIDKLNFNDLNNNLNTQPEKQQQNSLHEGILIAEKQPISKKQPQRRGLWQRFGFKNRDNKPKVKQKKQSFFSRFKIKRSQKQKVKRNQQKSGFFRKFRLNPRK